MLHLNFRRKNIFQSIFICWGGGDQQVEKTQDNWVPDIKITSSKKTCSSSCYLSDFDGDGSM